MYTLAFKGGGMPQARGLSNLDALLNGVRRRQLWAYYWSEEDGNCLEDLYNIAIEELQRCHGDSPSLTTLKPYLFRVRKRFDSFDDWVAEDLAARHYADFAPYLTSIREGNYAGLSKQHRAVLADVVKKRLAWFVADWLFTDEHCAKR